MRRYHHQLELLAPPPDPQPDRWIYAMYARYQDRTDKLMWIEADSEEQARAILTKQLNKQGKPYRGITCSLGKRLSLDGWPCCPIRREDIYL
jgi:hypothetical protein